MERLRSKSFLLTAVFGPLLLLGAIYLLFSLTGTGKRHWKVLIADPKEIMDNKIMAKEDASISYAFVNDYIEVEEFAKSLKFKECDALLEVNEKVFENKIAYFFYKEKPPSQTVYLIQYQFERRMEEIVVNQFTDLTLEKFRQLKQPINLGLRNAFDPTNQQLDLSAWVGYFFGCVIVLFIFLFGMTILRNTTVEKSNRIVEVLLASVKPRQLLLGKIGGVGIAALMQFVCWMLVIGLGLYFMRELVFPDYLDASSMDINSLANQMQNVSFQESYFRSAEYNQFVELVYERIQYGSMLFYFFLLFVLAYLFYSSFFASLGAVAGSESDGQQFIFPIIGILVLALYAGYFAIGNPEHSLTTFFSYLPFTSPVVLMVNIAVGYEDGSSFHLYLSLLVLILSMLIMLALAGRLYKNGILQFGHRLKLSHFFKWMRRA